MLQAKYIIFTEGGRWPEIAYPVVFPGTMEHSKVAAAMNGPSFGTFGPYDLKPVSAGFVDLETGEAYGESVSLDLKSRGEDTAILRKNLGYDR